METTMHKRPAFNLSEKSRNLIVDIICYLFIGLFVYTAVSKFMTLHEFKTILGRSPLTGPYSLFLAWSVPSVEIIISSLLLIPTTKRLGLLGATLLMSAFTLFLVYGLLSGSKLPCHCGGFISGMTWIQHVWFNVVFIALSIIGLKLSKK